MITLFNNNYNSKDTPPEFKFIRIPSNWVETSVEIILQYVEILVGNQSIYF